MKNLYFNAETLKGTLNPDFSIVLPVEDDFTVSKTVNIPSGETQKVDENGEKVYLKAVYRTEVETVFVCNEETTEVTETPLMHFVQKTDSKGKALFLEEIELENGDLDTFETTKEVNELGVANEPIMIEVQKCTSKGLPIYLRVITEDYEHQVLDHTEETTEVTNTPVMIPTYARSLVNVVEHPQYFTYAEVKGIYEEQLSEKAGATVKILDEINYESSVANTGLNILNLPPKGHVTYNRISLDKEVDVIEIPEAQDDLKYYVNNKLLSDSKVVLANPVKNITVKISNPTEDFIDVKQCRILCSKEIIVEE